MGSRDEGEWRDSKEPERESRAGSRCRIKRDSCAAERGLRSVVISKGISSIESDFLLE